MGSRGERCGKRTDLSFLIEKKKKNPLLRVTTLGLDCRSEMEEGKRGNGGKKEKSWSSQLSNMDILSIISFGLEEATSRTGKTREGY